jgi:alpha-mannosidase
VTSYEGAHDPVRSTQWAWQPFYPLTPVWLSRQQADGAPPPESFLRVEGDPVIVSCVKTAETSEAVIVRLIELSGREANSTLHFSPPAGQRIRKAYRANVLEEAQEPLSVTGNAVSVKVPAGRVVTVGVMME